METERNLVYLLRRGFQCFGVDREPSAIARVRALASELAPAVSSENFHVGELDDLPWADESMDAVICSAVLHFAFDEAHFARMVQEAWRVWQATGCSLRGWPRASVWRASSEPGEPGERVFPTAANASS